MATTEEFKNGGSTSYSFSIEYIKASDIKVKVDGAALTYTTNASPSSGQYKVVSTTVTLGAAAASGTGNVHIYRETDLDTAGATFVAGSSIRAADLNAIHDLTRLASQEQNQIVTTSDIRDSAVTSAKIDDGTIVNTDINASAAIAGTKVNPNFGSQAVSTSGTLASGAATVTGNISVSGTVDGRDVAADGTKLDTIESNATADQSNTEIRAAVEAASDSNVFTDADHSKLNAIEAGATTDQTDAEIRAAVEAASDSNVFTDADHSKLNAIEAGATADQTLSDISALGAATLTGSETLTNKTLTSPVINDMSGTAVVTSGTSTSDNKTYSAKRAGEIFYGKDTVGEIQSGETWSAADDKVATTSAIDARIIDLVDDVGGFVPIANETSFPNANPDVNNGTGTLVSIKALSSNLVSNGSGVATITNGTVGNSTVTITGLANSTTYASTFGMIVETTTTLNTYTFHRLVPKATEVTTVAGSISNVNTVAGSISNVNSVAGNATNINAVAGNNSNITSVAGNASNINSAVSNASNINSAVSNASNINTTAGSISNVNTVAGSISNVNQVASNLSGVNAFGERYSFGANNPTSDLDTGDLFFNTSANELKVYNGSSWQGGVTASGSFASTTGNTFTGDNLYNDNVKLKVGSGSDLQIYHDGSNTYSINSTGNLFNRSTGNVYLQVNGGSNENALVGKTNGAVELYFDNSKKIQTSSSGATLTGHLNVTSGIIIRRATAYASNDADELIVGDEGVNANQGITILAHTTKAGLINFGDGDNPYGVSRGSIKYDHADDSLAFSTGATERLNITSTGNVSIPNDSGKFTAGAGSDLQIYHNGSNSYQLNTTGDLTLGTGGTLRLTNAVANESYIKCHENAAVELYYDNDRKLRTVSSGAHVESATGDTYLSVYAEEDNSSSDAILRAYTNNNQAKCYLMFGDSDDAFVGGLAYYNSNDRLYVYSGNASNWSWDSSGNFENNSDSSRLKLGASADLQVYHNGTHSYIDSYTGALLLRGRGSGANISLQPKTGEVGVQITADGSVDLYYDGVSKFSTQSWGVDVTGTLRADDISLQDSHILKIGSDNDLQITHSGNDSTISKTTAGNLLIYVEEDFYLKHGTELMLSAKDDGAVQIYHDGSLRFTTQSWGTGFDANFGGNDNIKLNLGNGDDLQVYHDGSTSRIHSASHSLYLRTGNIFGVYNGAGSEEIIRGIQNGAVELYYDGVNKIQTHPNGVLVNGHIYGVDNNKILLGSSADLEIYHDGSNSYIKDSGTGGLSLTSNHFWVGDAANSDYLINAVENGAVELYYDGSRKLYTHSGGVAVTGGINTSAGSDFSGDLNAYGGAGAVTIQANSDIRFTTGTWTGDSCKIQNHGNWLYIQGGSNGHIFRRSNGSDAWYIDSSGNFYPAINNQYSIGTSNNRVANLYVNDLQLSNYAKKDTGGNDVDGTWGDWTLQEGEDNIFMINNRSGKKYKMALQEVA